MATARRSLALALAGVVVGSCGVAPPGPTATAIPTSASDPMVTDALRSTPTPTEVPGVPRLLIRAPAPEGASWSVTEPGETRRRVPLAAPFAVDELGPASADGSLLGTTAGHIFVARVAGETLTPTASAPMPPGHELVPACFDGGGQPLFADAETLALVASTPAGIQPVPAGPFMTGECAPLADGRTLVALDGGALVVMARDGRSSAVVGALGRHLSGGGGLVAMTDPASEPGLAVIRRGAVSDDGTLGAEIGRVAGDATDRIVSAQLSPDGRSFAVISERAANAETEGRLRLYAVDERGLTEVDDLEIEAGSRIVLMPDP